MGFVFPQFLWALVALGIPVAIHLFNLRRTVRVYFSSNHFLEQIKKRTGHKQKLKKLLLLLTRLCFLFFLILAFAKPFFFGTERNINTKRVVFYLDNSFSMSLQQNRIRAIDRGIEFIRNVVETFPQETRYKLITNDVDIFSTTFKSSQEIWDRLTQIQLSPTFRTAEEIKRKIGGDTIDATLFWISDFQKSTLKADKNITIDNDTKWQLIPTTSAHHTANIYIDSAYLEKPFLEGGRTNRLKVSITGTGLEQPEQIGVKLLIDNIQSGIATARITPGTFTVVSFDLTTNLMGLHNAQIHIDDPYVEFDNDFYLTLNFTKTIPVVEIRKAPSNTYIQKVFGNHKIFRYNKFPTDNIDYSELAKANLIVLNGLNKLDNTLLSTLTAILQQNTTLLFIPGDNPDLSTYEKLLPWPALKTNSTSDMVALDKPDLQNPFFENVFEAQDAPLVMPLAHKWFDWGKDRSAILHFKDMSPFLSKKNNFFVLACPMLKTYTNFYKHALFVPVMYKIAMASTRKEDALYHVLTRKVITLETGSVTKNTPLRIVGNQQEIIPNQYRSGTKTLLEIPTAITAPGLYFVKQREDTLNCLAINLDKRESDLRRYLPEELPFLYGDSLKTKIFQLAGTTIFTDEIKDRYLGTPLWKVALSLSLFFLFLETILIRYLK